MAELEIHHEGVEHDPLGQRIGILTSLLAVCLAIVTIASHRAHTEGVLKKADANDKWAYYQAKRIKFHNLELGDDLVSMLAPQNETTAKKLQRIKKEQDRYQKQAEEIEKEAHSVESEVETLEKRALRYDFGEGLIEIGLVLSSLYFISRKKYFPLIGTTAGVAGILVGASGLLV